jgi:hypothetical protein
VAKVFAKFGKVSYCPHNKTTESEMSELSCSIRKELG